MSNHADQSKEPPQRWTAGRKRAVVLELLQGRDTLAGIAHRHGLPAGTVMNWLDQGRREGIGSAPGGDGRRLESLLFKGIQPLQSRISGLA